MSSLHFNCLQLTEVFKVLPDIGRGRVGGVGLDPHFGVSRGWREGIIRACGLIESKDTAGCERAFIEQEA